MLILEYMYLGECQVGLDHMAAFFQAGKELKVTGILEEEQENEEVPFAETFDFDEGKASNDEIDSIVFGKGENKFEEQVFNLEDELLIENEQMPFAKTCDFEEENASNDNTESKVFGKGEYKFECDICFKKFDKQYKCVSHKRKERCKPVKPVKPVKPEKRRNRGRQSLLPSWPQSSPPGELCPVTKVLFFKCDLCDYKSKAGAEIKLHKLTKHEGLKFECGICGASYGRRGHLQEHIKAKHDNIRYSCKKCDFQSTRNGKLRSHIAIAHEGLILYCSECDYQGRQTDSLNSHMKAHHGGIVYRCEACEICFKDRYELNDHKKYNSCTQNNAV